MRKFFNQWRDQISYFKCLTINYLVFMKIDLHLKVNVMTSEKENDLCIKIYVKQHKLTIVNG